MEGVVASGFLVLPDGRCFAPRWSFYDAVLRAIADELGAPEGAELRGWLLGLLPGPADEEHVGYGPWYRAADGQLIARTLDLRELTPMNQRLICEAAKRAASSGRASHPEWLADCLCKLSDMVARFERGEPPLSRSDWVEIVPSEGRKIGPGWPVA
jgi:hypothetical protein